jgi:hypothetical protein
MTDIIEGLSAILKNGEGRLYDHERVFLQNAINHIHGLRAVAGKADGNGNGSFREVTADIPRQSYSRPSPSNR